MIHVSIHPYLQFLDLLEAPHDLVRPLLLEDVLHRENVLLLHSVSADLLDYLLDPLTAANENGKNSFLLFVGVFNSLVLPSVSQNKPLLRPPYGDDTHCTSTQMELLPDRYRLTEWPFRKYLTSFRLQSLSSCSSSWRRGRSRWSWSRWSSWRWNRAEFAPIELPWSKLPW